MMRILVHLERLLNVKYAVDNHLQYTYSEQYNTHYYIKRTKLFKFLDISLEWDYYIWKLFKYNSICFPLLSWGKKILYFSFLCILPSIFSSLFLKHLWGHIVYKKRFNSVEQLWQNPKNSFYQININIRQYFYSGMKLGRTTWLCISLLKVKQVSIPKAKH